MEQQDAEARLTTDRADTLQLIASLTADLTAVATASERSNSDDEHDPEGSTVAFEREQLAGLRSHAQAHLAEIEGAVARLHDGQYGRCQRCGQPIADARLQALPATGLCVTCAARRR